MSMNYEPFVKMSKRSWPGGQHSTSPSPSEFKLGAQFYLCAIVCRRFVA